MTMKEKFSSIHPELQAAAKIIPRFNYNLWVLRVLRPLMILQRGKKSSEDVLIENHFIPSDDQKAKIRLKVYKPKQSSGNVPALLWLHGGGYVFGKPEINEAFYLQAVRELGIVVVAPAYRHAPEAPFPKPLEDCFSALSWLLNEAKTLGIDKHRIAIGGESAGGGLAAALVQLAHDHEEITPIFQLLVYPMLDDTSAISSALAQEDYLVWTQASNRFGWESYLGTKCGTEALPAYAVPVRRYNLSGLPPAWIGVGTLDLFHDEDLAYAKRLQEAGVECALKQVEGAFHGFDFVAPQSQVAQDFRQSQLDALRKYLF